MSIVVVVALGRSQAGSKADSVSQQFLSFFGPPGGASLRTATCLGGTGAPHGRDVGRGAGDADGGRRRGARASTRAAPATVASAQRT